MQQCDKHAKQACEHLEQLEHLELVTCRNATSTPRAVEEQHLVRYRRSKAREAGKGEGAAAITARASASLAATQEAMTKQAKQARLKQEAATELPKSNVTTSKSGIALTIDYIPGASPSRVSPVTLSL